MQIARPTSYRRVPSGALYSSSGPGLAAVWAAVGRSCLPWALPAAAVPQALPGGQIGSPRHAPLLSVLRLASMGAERAGLRRTVHGSHGRPLRSVMLEPFLYI